MLYVNPTISIPESEIKEEFIHSRGAGGQNINKVATAVQLRFDIGNSNSLTPEVRKRLIRLAKRRVSGDGILIIRADRFRTQAANRKDALKRFVNLIRRASQAPRRRKRTRPTRAAKERRLEAKRLRAQTKRLRQRVRPEKE